LLTNLGTLSSASAGTDTVGVSFENSGDVVISAGTLAFTEGVTDSGVTTIATGAVADYADGGTFSGAISGAGMVEFGAAATLESGSSIAVGSIVLTSVLTLAAGLGLTNGTGDNFTFGGSPAVPAADDPPHRVNPDIAGGAGSSFTNDGTFTQTGPGASDVSVSFINAGLVNSTAGTLAFLGAVTNGGTIDAAGGVVSVATDVSGTGSFQIGATGTLSLLAGAASGQTIDFTAATGLLDLTHPLTFLGVISGFGGADQIDLLHTASTTFSVSGDLLTIKDHGATVARLDLGAGYSSADFTVQSDGHGGSLISYV